MNNRLVADRDDAAYVASSAVSSIALVALARSDGRSWTELGLARSDLGRGARVGGRVAAAVAAALVAAALHPRGRRALRDERAVDRGRSGRMRAALFRVPFGTVLLEEIAFRSVVPAVLAARIGHRRAALVTAGTFGAWHILPSRALVASNETASNLVGTSSAAAAGFATTSTAIAGLGFGWLRSASGSVAAPMLVHWTLNGVAYLVAGGAAGAGAAADLPDRYSSVPGRS